MKKVALQTLIDLHPEPSDTVFVICAQLSPPLKCHTFGSDLLGFTAQVVVVRHGDHQEEHSAEEEQHGRVGQDANLH